MKNKIIAASIYAVTFLVVTVIIAMLNNNYRNIFKFDFSYPVGKDIIHSGVPLQNLAKIKKGIENVVREEYKDSIDVIKLKTEEEIAAVQVDPILLDSIRVLKAHLARLEKQKAAQMQKQELEAAQDTGKVAYDKWLENAISYYEAMDEDQAAKIITKYSDNVARDIIYNMKKKKAVKILSALKPEIVNRLIQVEQ